MYERIVLAQDQRCNVGRHCSDGSYQKVSEARSSADRNGGSGSCNRLQSESRAVNGETAGH